MRGDYELLLRLRDKDQSALALAIRQYSKYVAAVVKKTLGPMGTPQDLEELTSDAFAALWENAEKLRDDSDLKYWLAVVARNASIRHRSKLKGAAPLEENMIFDGLPQEETEREERC